MRKVPSILQKILRLCLLVLLGALFLYRAVKLSQNLSGALAFYMNNPVWIGVFLLPPYLLIVLEAAALFAKRSLARLFHGIVLAGSAVFFLYEAFIWLIRALSSDSSHVGALPVANLLLCALTVAGILLPEKPEP